MTTSSGQDRRLNCALHVPCSLVQLARVVVCVRVLVDVVCVMIVVLIARDIVHVDVVAEPQKRAANLGHTWCGEVEDVVGALTPVGSGVAQVFHDLLVELRLLLVAEVEEGKEEDGQEEVKSKRQQPHGWP